MKHFNARTIVPLLALVSLSAVGCLSGSNETPTARGRTELYEQARTRVVLEDGVYPVVLGDDTRARASRAIKVVELLNVPVDSGKNPTPEKIRMIAEPLLRFRNVSHFDFTFEKNECTEIGFQNTEKLKAYTRAHIGSRLAVVIDNKVISHHKIREAIEADEVRITCCTVGGGDHLHKHLKELRVTSHAKRR